MKEAEKLMTDGEKQAIKDLVFLCHRDSRYAGWYDEHEQQMQRTPESDRGYVDVAFVASRLALVHSEISEALEGYRKGLMDDHLPEYPMSDVEIADAMIRLFDLAGYLGMESTLGEIIEKKLAYNRTRADHQREGREKII